MRVPAALLALPLVVGSLAGVLLVDAAPGGWSLCAAAAAILAALSAAAAFADESPLEATLAIAVGALAAGLSLGLSAAWDTYGHESVLPIGEPIVLEGKLREDALG